MSKITLEEPMTRLITHHYDGHGLTELCEVVAADARAGRGVLGKNEK